MDGQLLTWRSQPVSAIHIRLQALEGGLERGQGVAIVRLARQLRMQRASDRQAMCQGDGV